MYDQPISEPGRVKSVQEIESLIQLVFKTAYLKSQYYSYYLKHHPDLLKSGSEPILKALSILAALVGSFGLYVAGLTALVGDNSWWPFLMIGGISSLVAIVLYRLFLQKESARYGQIQSVCSYGGNMDSRADQFPLKQLQRVRSLVEDIAADKDTHTRFDTILARTETYLSDLNECQMIGPQTSELTEYSLKLREAVDLVSYAHTMNEKEKLHLDVFLTDLENTKFLPAPELKLMQASA